MGRQLTADELKRFGRVMAGHNQDKDRARWKRKLKGEAKPKPGRRVPKPGDDESPDEAADGEEEPR
jgi:hypothetical protein